MPKRKNVPKRLRDAGKDRPNPVVGWQSLEFVEARMKQRPNENWYILFIGPRANADRAARDFAKRQSGKLTELKPTPSGRQESETIEDILARKTENPLFEQEKLKTRPVLLLCGLERFSEAAHSRLKALLDKQEKDLFTCVASMANEESVPAWLSTHFLQLKAEFKSGRPKKTV